MSVGHPSRDDELRELRAYGRAMYVRAVTAEADLAVMEDRLHEALTQNDALRAELHLTGGERCVICRGLASAGDTVCAPCRRLVQPALHVVKETPA